MLIDHSESVVCECGHEGTVHWTVNEQPFTRKWEISSISGFTGKSVADDGVISLAEALIKMDLECPACRAVGKVSYI